MEFGSKYVYAYSNSSEEDVSEDEYEEGYDCRIPWEDSNVEMKPATLARRTIPPPPPHPAARVSTDRVVADADDDQIELQSSTSKHSKSKSEPSKVHHWMKKRSSVDSAGPGPSSNRPGSLVPRGGGAGDVVAKKWRRADTNVVAIKFDRLTAPSDMHTGDPIVCDGCAAMISHVSKLTQDERGNKSWICEFCGAGNPTDLVEEEIPSQPDVTYMVEPAPATTAAGRSGTDETLVVFCVDVSGSMCVSQEVEGTMRLKGNHADRYRSLNTEGENQWMPRQRRDVTYITRLQGLQAAVDNQLEELSKEHPKRRVGLVTFNSEVTVIGDGSAVPLTIAGDKLYKKDELTKIGAELDLPSDITASRETLGKKLFELEEGGQTALGPALLVSMTMACQVPGSKVIICTDGMANVGLGSLDNLATTEQFEVASLFYQEVSQIAKDRGVSVSVLTIAGTECKLVELGRVASVTGGQVNTVDPLKLTQEFGNILAEPIIATRVTATFVVHRGLYIRHEADKTSKAVKEVGNVTRETEITFEYGVRRSRKKPEEQLLSMVVEGGLIDPTGDGGGGGGGAAGGVGEGDGAVGGGGGERMDESEKNEPDELPFQVQIQYTDIDGAKAVRVLTQTKPVTTEREQAELYMNMPILGAHALQQSSAMAMEGEYTPSRLNAYMYQRMFYRNVDDSSKLRCYKAFNTRTASLDSEILQQQRVEARRAGTTVAALDEEYEEEEEDHEVEKEKTLGSRISQFFKKKTTPAKLAAPAKASRRLECPDSVANQIYQNRSSSSKVLEDP